MTSLLFTYINAAYLYYDDSYHSLTAYYVLGTLPIALYTWWYLFLKQLCKVGIIIPRLQSWKRDSDLQFASSPPAVQTEGYQILKVHGLLATPQGVCEDLSLSLGWI